LRWQMFLRVRRLIPWLLDTTVHGGSCHPSCWVLDGARFCFSVSKSGRGRDSVIGERSTLNSILWVDFLVLQFFANASWDERNVFGDEWQRSVRYRTIWSNQVVSRQCGSGAYCNSSSFCALHPKFHMTVIRGVRGCGARTAEDVFCLH
jgi:hypothetical protein